jgi:ABC-type siderophore export system fused ATPase/permease subunit
MSDDPTKMRNQPALTTTSGNSWLIVGALFAAITIATLVVLAMLPPSGLAFTAIVVIVTLYISMIVVRLVVHHRKRRLRIIAACFLAIALVGLSSVITIAAVNWAPL